MKGKNISSVERCPDLINLVSSLTNESRSTWFSSALLFPPPPPPPSPPPSLVLLLVLLLFLLPTAAISFPQPLESLIDRDPIPIVWNHFNVDSSTYILSSTPSTLSLSVSVSLPFSFVVFSVSLFSSLSDSIVYLSLF